MAFDNLPGVINYKVDGNLSQLATNKNPSVLIVGTAEKGESATIVNITKTSQATKTFGRVGTLSRGILETATGGALNIKAFRIGATPAKLSGVGTGITIETAIADDVAGTAYKLYWDDTAKRLRIWRASDDEIVYDNNPTYPDQAVDLLEVFVSGTYSGTPGNIGSEAVPLTLAAASGVASAVYTAGTDGTSLCRMRLWEELFKAYKLLEDAKFDIIIPMNAYLDDKNTQDMTTTQVATFNTNAPWTSTSTYPTVDTTWDGLGKVFVQEYEGSYYFWWDMNRDGVAEIWPTIGSASASADANGVALISADFHEVNFAYDLARFCFDKSENNEETLGVIGVLPPQSYGLASVSTWVGTLPTWSTAMDGTEVIGTNGTGLLGNKFMSGRKSNAGTGLPGLTIDGVDGRRDGGFIARSDVWLDSGTELKDTNDKLVDLGKYISVVPAIVILSNGYRDHAYIASGAAFYAGFFSSLPPNSAPTNKVVSGALLPFRVNLPRLDSLAGAGYVMFQAKPKGVVVSDAPTAAREASDYRRLSTVRIVKTTLDAIREVADPFIGEGLSGLRIAALQTAVDQVLAKLTKAGYLQRYAAKVISTPADQVLGKAYVALELVPAFELRQISVTVSLAAQ